MDLSKLKTGKKVPEEVNVVVEIPQGSYIKYEMDKDSGFVMVDRFAFTAMAYPFNYGFIPNTLAADGDPTDVLVISSYPVHPGCVIPARPVGMLEMEDEAGVDTKILAVPTAKVDPFYAKIGEIDDLGDAILNKIRHFFEHYKELEPGKWVKLKGFLPREKAYEDITRSAQK
ncbi:MAG: inorganic diphosphatase [Patescibacteria group bacterium]|nr:inorganic diphosphatase [Patescibacteria group bacterium]